jgi:beta-mannosidase
VGIAQAGVVRPLDQDWTARATGGPVPADIAGRTVPAHVPGTVHTDLFAAGLIPDLELDQNEAAVAWVGRCDWEYRTAFEWAADGHEHHDLVFEGLDTSATVSLNGEVLGETRNQHRTYRFAVRDRLRPGRNELVVSFESPVSYADRMSLELGYRPHEYPHPFNSVRKAAYNYGWDWGPDAPSVGLWRQVSLHSWSGARIAAARPVVTLDGGTGRVALHVDLDRDPGREVVVRASVEGTPAVAEARVTGAAALLDLVVPDPELWWPRGFGAQPLYRLTAELLVDGVEVARWSRRVGFRTATAEFTPDEHGTAFWITVNGTPIWVRGANWIPDDVFQHRVDAARYAQRLDQAAFANVHLLRVWGGGHYESDAFYDLCDERGFLVWQDFLFTCATYAEEEPLRGEVEAEVRDNVTRLAPHPSLILWGGNNENLWGLEEWRWEKRLQGRTWGHHYYFEMLPRLVADLDPGRAYTPASPWSGTREHAANDTDHGLVHLWDTWNQFDYNAYRDYVPRFCAEFGWQGPPTWTTLTRALSDRPLTPESPGMLSHQKAPKGNDKLTDGLLTHFALPDDMEDWHWAMSLNQALAMTLAISHLRSWRPRCAGSVVWQLNDCWPGTTWSAVDGDGRAKPLLYALRHVYEDRFLTVQPRDGGLVLAVDNDFPEVWRGTLVTRRLRFDGTTLAEQVDEVALEARSSVVLPLPDVVASPDDAGGELVVCELDGRRGLWFFAEYRDSSLPEAELTTEVRRTPGGAEVTVTATTLVRDLALLVDKADPTAVVDDMLVTLLPGESRTFVVTAEGPLDADRLTSAAVLRTGNQLARHRP